MANSDYIVPIAIVGLGVFALNKVKDFKLPTLEMPTFSNPFSSWLPTQEEKENYERKKAAKEYVKNLPEPKSTIQYDRPIGPRLENGDFISSDDSFKSDYYASLPLPKAISTKQYDKPIGPVMKSGNFKSTDTTSRSASKSINVKIDGKEKTLRPSGTYNRGTKKEYTILRREDNPKSKYYVR